MCHSAQQISTHLTLNGLTYNRDVGRGRTVGIPVRLDMRFIALAFISTNSSTDRSSVLNHPHTSSASLQAAGADIRPTNKHRPLQGGGNYGDH